MTEPKTAIAIEPFGLRALRHFGDLMRLAWPVMLSRAGILVEFLPKFVTPIEDLLSDLDQAFLDNADPKLRQLLGFSYPWPSSPPSWAISTRSSKNALAHS